MGSFKAFVTRRIFDEALDLLRTIAEVEVWPDPLPPPPEILRDKARDKDALLTMLTDRIDASLLDNAPRLKVVSNMAVGYDNIDVPACTQRGIPVGHTPGVLTETTADLTFALLLATARRLIEADQFTRKGLWETWDPMLLLGQEVYGATLGIIGLGRIGSAVARRARGFQMKILYTGPRRHPEREKELGASFVPLENLLRQSDFVTLHCPLTPETFHLLGEKELHLMKPSAILVNTGRGSLIDTNALYRSLKERWIWGAGLDVFEEEPLPPHHPLLSLPNVVIAPHIGSATIQTRKKMALLAVQNILSALRGEPLPHCVNPEVYSSPPRRG